MESQEKLAKVLEHNFIRIRHRNTIRIHRVFAISYPTVGDRKYAQGKPVAVRLQIIKFQIF